MGLFDIFRKKPVDGTYDDSIAFRIVVEDVFSITGKGSVITGRIQSGCVAIGDIVTLRRRDGSVREVAVCGIEMFRKMLNRAVKGDNVGLLLRGLTKDDVGKGDILER